MTGKQPSFKIGDRVIKARPYSTEEYCLHGGSAKDVPLGTKGTVTEINVILFRKESNNIRIKFDNGENWLVHTTEVDLIVGCGKREICEQYNDITHVWVECGKQDGCCKWLCPECKRKTNEKSI